MVYFQCRGWLYEEDVSAHVWDSRSHAVHSRSDLGPNLLLHFPLFSTFLLRGLYRSHFPILVWLYLPRNQLFVTLWLFRHYLKDSFFNVQLNPKAFFKTVFLCTDIMLAYFIIFFELARHSNSENMLFAANGTLPLVEMEIFSLSSYLVTVNPVGGLISILIFAPVTMSCVYYASAFAPFCAKRPWLAYLMMAIVLAIPRILSSLTFWIWDEDLLLYFAQLPLHLIACYAYQKTDTVWAPIVLHTVANGISCLFFLLLF